jgi:hypothetical protein
MSIGLREENNKLNTDLFMGLIQQAKIRSDSQGTYFELLMRLGMRR